MHATQALAIKAPRNVIVLFDYNNDDERLLNINEGEVPRVHRDVLM